MINAKEIFPAEICVVNHKPYIFSNLRIDRKTIPENFVAYDVRDDCDGEFWQIQPYVMVNHCATIIGLDELPMGKCGYTCQPEQEDPDRSSEGWFIDGGADSFEDFESQYGEFLRDAQEV